MDRLTYTRDINSEGIIILANVIQTWHLRVQESSTAWDTLYLVGEHCHVIIDVSDDYFNVDLQFLDPKELGKRFKLAAYLVATCGPNGAPRKPSVQSNEQDFDRALEYYQLILEKYMAPPLAGDYTWVTAYDNWETSCKKVDEFLDTLPWGDDRDEDVLSKQVDGDDTWVEDGKRLYFEIHGKEMD